jgi:hypothetical protein
MFEGTTSLFCRTDGYCIRDIVAKQRLLKFFHESTWSYWFRNGRFLLPKAIQSASKLESVPKDIRLDMHIMHQITL